MHSVRSNKAGGATQSGLSTLCSIDELNDLLSSLSDIFPVHDIACIRESILLASGKASPTSRRFEVAAATLADLNTPAAPQGRKLEEWQRFRPESYKAAVTKTLRLEFSKFRRQTVMAILAENNYDYARSRRILLSLNSRSWRNKILSLFTPRYKWKQTGCAELDQEIDMVRNGDRRREQLASDALLAQSINEEQYRTADALFECQCCFGEFAWEDICFCVDLHSFCRNCLQRSVEEGLYGQGFPFDYARASVKCVSSIADPPCRASISPPLLPCFLSAQVFSSLEDHLVSRALDISGIALLQCPFCCYAVVEEENEMAFRIVEDDHDDEIDRERRRGNIFGPAEMIETIPRVLGSLFTPYLTSTYTNLLAWMGFPVTNGSREDRRRPRWETIFRCENPSCQRCSCVVCRKEWVGMHDCVKSETENKKIYIAKRMDEALKRTCPKCKLSFIKNGGCNRMTCRCGFQMCYLCRANLLKDSAHYCCHFQSTPGARCMKCTKCLLFEEEAVEDVLKQAQRAAEEEWENRKLNKRR